MNDKYGIKAYQPDAGWVWVTETQRKGILRTRTVVRREFDSLAAAELYSEQTAGKTAVVKLGSSDEKMFDGRSS